MSDTNKLIVILCEIEVSETSVIAITAAVMRY